ncbi:MAG: urease accessory protein UreE [Betaproteobacteria bacterium RBG_16_58_11]|nr:MAG: urease accessory protein UreE [Betaproteobacteria bacterium RBG_16_58_11]
MLVIERHATQGDSATEQLVLSFELRCKCRLRTRAESGEDVGLFLERGAVLHHGDKLLANDGRIVEVIAAAEALMEAQSPAPLLLARAAYHLGNRHVAVQLGAGWLRFASDHVLRDMVLGLGLPVTEIIAPFEPESGAYGHGHTHGGETSTASVIHQYRALS